MKGIFTKELVVKLIVEVLILGGVVWGIQFYFENKYKPIIASETLKKENFLNSKRDAYFEAILVANKVMANSDYDTIDAYTGNKIPSAFLHKHNQDLSDFELEINTAYSKLMLFTSDTIILRAFFRIFVTPPGEKHIPIVEMKRFIEAIRKDLGNENDLPNNYEMLYIVMPSKKESSKPNK